MKIFTLITSIFLLFSCNEKDVSKESILKNFFQHTIEVSEDFEVFAVNRYISGTNQKVEGNDVVFYNSAEDSYHLLHADLNRYDFEDNSLPFVHFFDLNIDFNYKVKEGNI